VVAGLSISGTADAKRGFYMGLGVGFATVSGETAIELKNPNKDPDLKAGGDARKIVSTEEGEGVLFDFRLGYNILGVTAIEFNISAGGNELSDWDKIEGHGGFFGLVKLYPAQFFPEVVDRQWDLHIYAGAGLYFMAYQPQAYPNRAMETDGRGWYPSFAVKWGFGGEYYLPGDFLSLGLDLGFTHGYHSTFIVNSDDGTESEAKDTATSFAFQPTFTMTFHIPE
jgi:hypothetical protein